MTAEFPDKMAARLHDEAYIHQNGTAHVVMVYSDGEIVFTKGGELFGQRGMHCIRPSFIPVEQDPGFFPMPSGKTSHAIVKNSEEGDLLREALWKWWEQVQESERKSHDRFFDYKKK